MPVVAVLPNTADQRTLLGFDILGDPGRRRAADEAATTGRPTFSAPVQLAQSDRAGYFLVHALVTPGSAGRNSPIGFVSSALPLEVLLQRAERRLPTVGP